jgi:hypothetical protein
MKRLTALLLCIGLTLVAQAGCSPTQKQWVNRANKGLENEKGNNTKILNLAQKGIDAKKDDSLRAASDQLIAVLSGTAKNVETGEVIELTPDYIRDVMKILQAELAIIDQTDQAKLNKARADIEENRRQVKEAINQIDRLNTLWSGADAQSGQLADLWTQLQGIKEKLSQTQEKPGE